MSGGLGNSFKKTLTRPPLPMKKGKPRITIVKVSKELTSTPDDLFTIDIDDDYAYVSGTYYGENPAKPAWFTSPNTKDFAIWFSQNPYNSIIIHQDIKYILVHVAKGTRRDVPCSNKYCKKWSVDTQEKCSGHQGAGPGLQRTYDKRWILRPVTLPTESENWVNEHLKEVL